MPQKVVGINKMPIGIYKRTKEHGEKISASLLGHRSWSIGYRHTQKTIEKMRLRRHSLEARKKISDAHKKSGLTPPHGKGEKCPNWRGGITPINKMIRKSPEYKNWRLRCFERDSWTCQNCGKIGGQLHAHHIKSFAQYPNLRFEITNGQTLCKGCHKKTDNYAGKGLKRSKKCWQNN